MTGVGGDAYIWPAFANGAGYATLATDRLGHGRNARIGIDPVRTAQGPMHVAILHELITATRTNSPLNALGLAFSSIAYVSHSFGSMAGSQLARKHPVDLAAPVLKGYSTSINFTAAALAFVFEHAVLRDPARIPGVPLPPTPPTVALVATAAATTGQFPNRGVSEVCAPTNTGHDLTLHYFAQ
ncbi:hypothetical protein B0T18DRAFT_429834 [Schizothecium vesticola]|uniref:AB hydrolase-1 domain-containing protein n=1 Tax=Schizothecium vesticola TaxID=314040 RepID=A0AA40EX16_9PEZI|nr:hypothetical protein B0T18DRAFT_429834 [Schizothecium vesticola]